MNRRPCGRPKKMDGKIWTDSMDVQPLTSRVAEWKSPSPCRNREVPYHKGAGGTSRAQTQLALCCGKVGIGSFPAQKKKAGRGARVRPFRRDLAKFRIERKMPCSKNK